MFKYRRKFSLPKKIREKNKPESKYLEKTFPYSRKVYH